MAATAEKAQAEPGTAAVPTTLEAWKGAKRHTVTLWSGIQVEIEIPNLPKMLAGGSIPNGLVQAAVAFAQKPKITPELVQEQYDFALYIVTQTVKVPVVEEADVESIPYEDLEMLLEFATRQRDMDAVGCHLAGLEKIESFRRFRGLPDSDDDLARL
jgi:hypothetical protein